MLPVTTPVMVVSLGLDSSANLMIYLAVCCFLKFVRLEHHHRLFLGVFVLFK